MFEVGFTELLLVGVVALLVVGPEKLPGVIRTAIQYFRQFKNSVSHIRDEVERELALDEIKRDIDSGKKELNKAIGYDELHETLNELKQETGSLYHIGDRQSEDEVSDEEIETDLSALEDQMGPRLPDANEQADTGIETDVQAEIDTEKQPSKNHKKGEQSNKEQSKKDAPNEQEMPD